MLRLCEQGTVDWYDIERMSNTAHKFAGECSDQLDAIHKLKVSMPAFAGPPQRVIRRTSKVAGLLQ